MGKTIFLWCEQGFGDTLLFIRFAIELKKQGAAQVLLLCQTELAELLKLIPEIDQVLIEGDEIPQFDYQSALLSVPLHLKTSLETIPVEVRFSLLHWKGKNSGTRYSQNMRGRRSV